MLALKQYKPRLLYGRSLYQLSLLSCNITPASLVVEACSNLAEGCSLHFVHLPWLVKLCALNLSGNLSGSSLQHHLVSCQWEEALGLILFGHFSVSFQQPVFAEMAVSWQQFCLMLAQQMLRRWHAWWMWANICFSLRHIRSKLFACLSQSIFLLLQLIALGFPPLSLLESFLLA